ncbi:hypothetical protein ACTXT7_005521 [Hymenolepis weldensis]
MHHGSVINEIFSDTVILHDNPLGIENRKRECPSSQRLDGVTEREAVEVLARLAQEDKEPVHELPMGNVLSADSH